MKALAIAEQFAEPIQLLITDVVMPKLSGRELATRLSAARPDLKVLYISVSYTHLDVYKRQRKEQRKS